MIKNFDKSTVLSNKFAENLHIFRTQAKITQKQLGKLLGFSARSVSDWENAKTEPNIQTIKCISTLFNVSYEELID